MHHPAETNSHVHPVLTKPRTLAQDLCTQHQLLWIQNTGAPQYSYTIQHTKHQFSWHETVPHVRHPFRWNHASSVKQILSEMHTLLWMKSRNHSQYWWRCRASGSLCSCTIFTQYTQNFKRLRALCVDPHDTLFCGDKYCTDFWGDHNIHSWTSLMKSGATTSGLPFRRPSSTDPVSWNWCPSSYRVFLHGARILGYLRNHNSIHTSHKSYT